MTEISLQGSLYETDIVTWAERQVAELRRLAAAAPSNAVDWDNVIEEIECVGRSEWKGVNSQLRDVFVHVLKGVFDPGSLSFRAWGVEVVGLLLEVRSDFRPSMRSLIDLDRAWLEGFRVASESVRGYRISIPPGIPATCPFTLDEILDEAFTFDAAVRRLHLLITNSQETPI